MSGRIRGQSAAQAGNCPCALLIAGKLSMPRFIHFTWMACLDAGRLVRDLSDLLRRARLLDWSAPPAFSAAAGSPSQACVAARRRSSKRRKRSSRSSRERMPIRVHMGGSQLQPLERMWALFAPADRFCVRCLLPICCEIRGVVFHRRIQSPGAVIQMRVYDIAGSCRSVGHYPA